MTVPSKSELVCTRYYLSVLQEHLRDDIETGSGWSYGGPDETAGSVSLSWNEFQTFELAARTNESSVWGHWENMRSMRSSRLHSFSDLMIPASIFDVGTTGMRDDDTHLAKVFSPGHNHFMAPSGIESEFSTELGSNRSPISCRQLETLGGGPGRCSEQPSSVRCAKASSQLQQSLASSTNRWSGIPVLEVSGRKKMFSAVTQAVVYYTTIPNYQFIICHLH